MLWNVTEEHGKGHSGLITQLMIRSSQMYTETFAYGSNEHMAN
jgi:hypothetical protein